MFFYKKIFFSVLLCLTEFEFVQFTDVKGGYLLSTLSRQYYSGLKLGSNLSFSRFQDSKGFTLGAIVSLVYYISIALGLYRSMSTSRIPSTHPRIEDKYVPTPLQYHEISPSRRIAYRHHVGTREPTILYIPGFFSNMELNKVSSSLNFTGCLST